MKEEITDYKEWLGEIFGFTKVVPSTRQMYEAVIDIAIKKAKEEQQELIDTQYNEINRLLDLVEKTKEEEKERILDLYKKYHQKHSITFMDRLKEGK